MQRPQNSSDAFELTSRYSEHLRGTWWCERTTHFAGFAPAGDVVDVLRITLARPERRNAFDAALIAELTEAFSDVGDARAVLLSGEGPSFCAGADVEWQRASIDLSYDENVEDAMRLYREVL